MNDKEENLVSNHWVTNKYRCIQCGNLYDYKEMADEKTCQECVSFKREVQKVDFKRLLESMPDEDINEEMTAYDQKKFKELEDELDDIMEETEKEYYQGFAYKRDNREKIIDETEYWYSYIDRKKSIQPKRVYKLLANRIIKLIK